MRKFGIAMKYWSLVLKKEQKRDKNEFVAKSIGIIVAIIFMYVKISLKILVNFLLYIIFLLIA